MFQCETEALNLLQSIPMTVFHEHVCMVTMFYIKTEHNKSWLLPEELYYHTQFQDSVESRASVTPAKQVSVSTMLS